ncbi:MAG: nuclear transport factor 2 family protein [Candidatus Thiodiazotropha sp. 6PLUC2]
MSDIEDWLSRYKEFFEHIDNDGLKDCDRLFSDQVRFKDPFNDVRGVAGVKRVFQHMFNVCETSRFEIHNYCGHGDVGYISWTFHYLVKGKLVQQRIEGLSEVKFNPKGEVIEHIDYWDSGEYVYENLPVIGWVLNKLRNRYLRAS